MFRKFFAVAVLLALSCGAWAEEGFYTLDNHLPPALAEIEKATVAVWSRSTFNLSQISGATAVLVKMKAGRHGGRVGLFLTNAHVMATCPRNACGYRVYHHFIYTGLERPMATDRESWSADIKVLAVDAGFDLAAFTVDLPSKFNGAPAPMRAWAKNDSPRVYALGHPKTDLRSEWHVSKPARERRTLWSTGLVGQVHDNVIHGHSVKLVYSSTDLLPGSSGGPLVDVNGNLVGINRSIQSLPHFTYGASLTYALSLSIETVQEFLGTINF